MALLMGMWRMVLFVSRNFFSAVARNVLPDPGKPIMRIFCGIMCVSLKRVLLGHLLVERQQRQSTWHWYHLLV